LGSYYIYIPYLYMGIDPIPSLSRVPAEINFPGGKLVVATRGRVAT